MLKERMSRKGQEGVTLTTLLLIILGVVVVVVIILGFTGAFGFIFDKVNILPGQDLQAVVTSCEIAGANKLVADYCLTFKEVEINGQKQYVNCDDSRVKAGMKEDSVKLTCDDTENAVTNAKVNLCLSGKIKAVDYGKSLINGDMSCSILMGVADTASCSNNINNGYKLEQKPACSSGEFDVTNFLANKPSGDNKACCIIKVA